MIAAGCGLAHAQDTGSPQLETNEAYVENVVRRSRLVITDPMAVFDLVLQSLPDRVKVYPTENYYYFNFVFNGTPYAGNIKFDPRDRDKGKVQFSYYPALTQWNDRMKRDVFFVLDSARGVAVERVESLVYRVTYAEKSVIFVLNDLANVKPPHSALAPDETFLGPSFDKSAMRFFVVYNTRLRIFHFILDETVKVADDLVRLPRTDQILLGRRTGFAFYRDHRTDRKILIGVFEPNSRINNYFDGPFDQLPENFIEGKSLRRAMIESDPNAKGQIDRLGNYTTGGGRFLVHPYMLYRRTTDLYSVHRCANGKKHRRAAYYRCFVIDSAALAHRRGSQK